MDTADGAGNLGKPAQLNTDYWEDPAAVSCRLLSCFVVVVVVVF